MKETLSHQKTLLILFLEGFVSVSLQIFIMRQLVPFVGNSVVVMSLVVGIFLASLSAGYMQGGKHKENHLNILFRNLFVSSILISIFFSYSVIEFSFFHLNNFIGFPMIEVGIFLAFALTPIIFLLGQTIPILTNFLKKISVSELTGIALSINTVGSVLGSIVTSLVFFYFFGMAATVFINVFLLSILMLMISSKKIITVIATIPILIMSYFINIDFEKSNFVLTTGYANYEIKHHESNDNKMVFLLMNKSYSSAIINKKHSFPYIEYMKDTLFNKLKIKNKKILVLGAGGFTISHKDKGNNTFTYVDIDTQIKSVVEKHFLKSKINGDFVAEDARSYVKNTKEKYDVIVVDLYSNHHSIPWHVITKEFMIDVNSVLKNDGNIMLNIISKVNFGDKYSKTIHNTIISTFDYCYSVPMMSNDNEKINLEYLCRKAENEEKHIYIDDISRSSIDHQ
jgi:predicted membrane-bound spermidine synthase